MADSPGPRLRNLVDVMGRTLFLYDERWQAPLIFVVSSVRDLQKPDSPAAGQIFKNQRSSPPMLIRVKTTDPNLLVAESW